MPPDGGASGEGGLTLPTTEAGLPIIPNFGCDPSTGGFTCNPALPAFLPGACPLTSCVEKLPSFACAEVSHRAGIPHLWQAALMPGIARSVTFL